MHTSQSTKSLIVSTTCRGNEKKHVVIVDSRVSPADYSHSDQGIMLENMRELVARKLGFKGPDNELCLTIMSFSRNFIVGLSPKAMCSIIGKQALRACDTAKGINIGIVVVSQDAAAKFGPEPMRYLNVVLPYKSKTGGIIPQPVSVPVTTEASWALSVPSRAWLNWRSGDTGINLVGYVIRAMVNVMRRCSEGSIFFDMLKYHRGKSGTYTTIKTIKQFKGLLNELAKASVVSIDTEADSLNRISNTIFTIQLLVVCKGKMSLWVLPINHQETPWGNRELDFIKKALKRYFEVASSGHTHVYQNAKYDIHQLMSLLHLEFYAADIYDTQAGAFSLEENAKFLSSYGISAYGLGQLETTMEYTRSKNLVISKKDRSRMAEFSLAEIAQYGIIDVLTPYYIMKEQVRIANERGYPDMFKFITKQMGVMILAMTEMEHRGIPIDTDYLESIASPLGPLADSIRDAATRISKSEAVGKANRFLLNTKSSYTPSGLFGKVTPPNLWDIRKVEHLQLLFFGVLKLEAENTRDDGAGALDSAFQTTHRHVPEVAMFTEYQKLSKLKSAFADAINKFMKTHPDMKDDKRLRPTFKYLGVTTGRSSTVAPSTQQIPTHGKYAKIIKKQFSVDKSKYRIQVKADFSAHEVRVSGNLSEDPVICKAVDQLNSATKSYRLVSPEDKAKAKKRLAESDIHILNFKTFFGVMITKDDPRRQLAKAAVFSVTYGSKAPAVGKKMHGEKLKEVEDKIYYHEHGVAVLPPKEVMALKRELKGLRTDESEDYYLKQAEELLAVLAVKWGVLTEFVEAQQAIAREDHVVFGPHGRPRHLWGQLCPDKYVGFGQDRRTFNSLSQGFASDFGFVAIYLLWKLRYDLIISRGYDIVMNICNAVHDSSSTETEIKYLPIVCYLTEHAMVSKSVDYYRDNFKFSPKSRYGFDMEIGFREDSLEGWDKRPDGLRALIIKFGKEAGMPRDEIKRVLHDNAILGKLRMKELSSSNPYEMTLGNSSVYDRVVPRLNMFKKEPRASRQKG